MRMDHLRSVGATDRANRKECGTGGSESIERWASIRKEAIEWKQSEGWDKEHAIAYTLLTGCNRAALARSVRERSGNYAASLHLIEQVLATRAANEPAPDLYHHLLGRHGLATNDAAWKALLAASNNPYHLHAV